MKKAVNALIIKNKRLLLFRKNLTWTLPGGKPEKGESDIETLVREFKEEASGAEIKLGRYYRTFLERATLIQEPLEAALYFAKIKSPNLKLTPSGEIKEIRFVGYFGSFFIYLSNITRKIIKQLFEERYL